MANAAAITTAARKPALAGREAVGTGVKLSVLAPATRLSLRAPAASVTVTRIGAIGQIP